MTAPKGKVNRVRIPRYKTMAVVFLLVSAVVLTFWWFQFRGELTPKTRLTMVAARSGLVMDPGSKITYNGVEIGRVAGISEIQRDGKPAGANFASRSAVVQFSKVLGLEDQMDGSRFQAGSPLTDATGARRELPSVARRVRRPVASRNDDGDRLPEGAK